MTYDKPNETLRFVWRNESFRFRFFGRVRVQNETKRTVALRVMELAGLGIFVHEGPRSGRHSQASCLKERCAASRLEGRSEATNTFVAALERSLLRAGFRGRPAALQNEVWGTPRREKSCVEAHLSH